MAIDHMLFNRLKWWQSSEPSLIGKTCRVKNPNQTYAYTFESGSGYAGYQLNSLDGGTILGEQKSAFIYTSPHTTYHMISWDEQGKWWVKVEDVEIVSEG